jgi:probable addiction module antidote protein
LVDEEQVRIRDQGFEAMSIDTNPFDVAEVLNSEERIAAYLEEAFETGDSLVIASAIDDVVRSRNISTLARTKRDGDVQLS